MSECPESCCNGTEILCTSIPCPINIVLLGIRLQIEIPCIRVSSPLTLTPEQVQSLLQVIINIITNLGSIITSSPLATP